MDFTQLSLIQTSRIKHFLNLNYTEYQVKSSDICFTGNKY